MKDEMSTTPDRRELFPMTPLTLSKRGSELPLCANGRKKARWRHATDKCVQEIMVGLNSLATGRVQSYGSEQGHPSPAIRNAAQGMANHYLRGVAKETIRRGLKPTVDGSVESSDYLMDSGAGSTIWLDPPRVSLPSYGVAGSAAFLDFLPERFLKVYENEENLLRKGNPGSAAKAFVGIKREKYEGLIYLLRRVGLVQLQRHRPKVVNGIFAVPKGETQQRLIIDARPANAVLADPPKVVLPNPGNLGNLILRGEGPLFVAKSDMENFYHRLRMPKWLHQYFGLPPLPWKGEEWWPVVVVLPMGWSHSVFIGQAIHESIVAEAGLNLAASFQHSPNLVVDVARHGEYIDDFFVLGATPKILLEQLNQVIRVCTERNIPPHPEKVVTPGAENPTVVLGLEIWQDGVIRPEREKLGKVRRITAAYAEFRSWKTVTLQRILGHWTWFLLLRRPLLSVFSAVYTHTHKPSEFVFKPTRAMREELRCICRLSPCVSANLRRRFNHVCISTDASLWGAGVTYAEMTDEEGQNMHQDPENVRDFVKSKPWKLAVRHKWKKTEKIHILEGEAVLLGIRWALRNQANHGKRLAILTDNTALLGALKKGRSPQPRFNGICRRVAAFTLAGNLHIDFHFVRSEDNPADGPSRPV